DGGPEPCSPTRSSSPRCIPGQSATERAGQRARRASKPCASGCRSPRPRSAGASATCSEPGSGPATPRRCPCEERRAPSADCRLLDDLRQPQELRRELVPLAARPPEVDEYDGLPLRAVERDAHLAPLRPGRNARDGQRFARGAQLLEARRERAWHEIDDRAGGERGAELARSRDGGMQARLA